MYSNLKKYNIIVLHRVNIALTKIYFNNKNWIFVFNVFYFIFNLDIIFYIL